MRERKKRIYLTTITNRKKETLNYHLERNINKNSIVYTDLWKGYTDLKEKFYKHETVNHSKFFKDPISGVHTNTIEGNWLSLIHI